MLAFWWGHPSHIRKQMGRKVSASSRMTLMGFEQLSPGLHQYVGCAKSVKDHLANPARGVPLCFQVLSDGHFLQWKSVRLSGKDHEMLDSWFR